MKFRCHQQAGGARQAPTANWAQNLDAAIAASSGADAEVAHHYCNCMRVLTARQVAVALAASCPSRSIPNLFQLIELLPAQNPGDAFWVQVAAASCECDRNQSGASS